MCATIETLLEPRQDFVTPSRCFWKWSISVFPSTCFGVETRVFHIHSSFCSTEETKNSGRYKHQISEAMRRLQPSILIQEMSHPFPLFEVWLVSFNYHLGPISIPPIPSLSRGNFVWSHSRLWRVTLGGRYKYTGKLWNTFTFSPTETDPFISRVSLNH